MQSRLMSAIESFSNLITGYIISVFLLYFIMPLYGIKIEAQTSMEIVFWFTIASFARSYLLRRLFNFIEIIRNKTILAKKK